MKINLKAYSAFDVHLHRESIPEKYKFISNDVFSSSFFAYTGGLNPGSSLDLAKVNFTTFKKRLTGEGQ